MTPGELDRFRADKIGFIFQQFHLIPYLTAVENVMLAQYFHSMTDEAEARAALDRVGLGARAAHLPSELSGGEQQRVCIARALINNPPILLADEPTGNLDAANQRIVIDLLQALHARATPSSWSPTTPRWPASPTAASPSTTARSSATQLAVPSSASAAKRDQLRSSVSVVILSELEAAAILLDYASKPPYRSPHFNFDRSTLNSPFG